MRDTFFINLNFVGFPITCTQYIQKRNIFILFYFTGKRNLGKFDYDGVISAFNLIKIITAAFYRSLEVVLGEKNVKSFFFGHIVNFYQETVLFNSYLKTFYV